MKAGRQILHASLVLSVLEHREALCSSSAPSRLLYTLQNNARGKARFMISQP